MLQYLQDYDETFPPTVTEREGVQANINNPIRRCLQHPWASRLLCSRRKERFS